MHQQQHQCLVLISQRDYFQESRSKDSPPVTRLKRWALRAELLACTYSCQVKEGLRANESFSMPTSLFARAIGVADLSARQSVRRSAWVRPVSEGVAPPLTGLRFVWLAPADPKHGCKLHRSWLAPLPWPRPPHSKVSFTSQT